MNTQKIANLLRQLADEFETGIDLSTNSNDYWTINIPKGLTEEQAYKDCEALFPCYTYLDLTNITSDRTSKKAYSIKVKANVEADEEFKNLSADDLKEKGIKGIALLERLVLEKDYFQKTGKHLDIDNVTLCSGSRCPGGGVPFASWGGGEFCVFYCDPGGRNPDWRSRSCVL